MTYPPDEPPRRPPFTPPPQQPWPPQGQQPQGPWPPYGQQPYPPPQQYAPPPQPPRRRRHRGLRIFAFSSAGLFIAVVAIVIAANGSKSTPGPAAATSATAPATPAASSSPAAAAARTVATFTGSGQETTPRFTVTATWKLVYSFSCAAFGQAGNFQVFEDGGNDLNGVSVNDLAMSKSASTWAYGDAGTHYLAINSECSWKVKIIDEP